VYNAVKKMATKGILMKDMKSANTQQITAGTQRWIILTFIAFLSLSELNSFISGYVDFHQKMRQKSH